MCRLLFLIQLIEAFIDKGETDSAIRFYLTKLYILCIEYIFNIKIKQLKRLMGNWSWNALSFQILGYTSFLTWDRTDLPAYRIYSAAYERGRETGAGML